MRATLTLLLCLILCWHFTVVVCADSGSDQIREQADQLLELSKAQNPSNHALAAETAKQALALYRSINDTPGLADTYSHLGDCYYAQNLMNEAAESLDQALQIWRRQSDTQKTADALIMLGYIEGRRGELLNGISYLTQAQTLLDEQKDFAQLGGIASGMAFVFTESGLPENALTQSERARQYFERAGEIRSAYRQVLQIGYTHFLLQNYASAVSVLNQALDHFQKSNDRRAPLDIAECHEYLGRVYFALGQYDVALKHLEPVAAQYDSAANGRDAAQVRALIGQIYERSGDTDRAREMYVEASKIFRLPEVDDRVNDAAVRFALGRLELNNNNYDAAESDLKDSIAVTEDLRVDLKSRLLASAFSASVHDRYEAYIECLMRKHNQKPSPDIERQAFEASELARARSLAELLRDTQTKVVAGADPNLVQHEKTLRQAIRAKIEDTVSLFTGEYTKSDLNDLESSLTRLREQHKAVVRQLQKQDPEYDHIKEPATYSIQQIQESIIADDDTTLLEYFLGRNASYVWAITRNNVSTVELHGADEITDAVREVYRLLSHDPSSDTDKQLNEASAKLSELILTPVANQLHGRRLIVVADGALNYIPFQILPTTHDNPTPLVANYEIVNAPSASILGQLRQEKQHRQPKTRILAAFGDPVFQSNYARFKNAASINNVVAAAKANEPESKERASRSIDVQPDELDPATIQPLLYSQSELKKLNEIAGTRAAIFRGFDASREVLETTDFSKYAILHFATHGLLDPKNPENSGFYLSMIDPAGQPEKGFIKLQDIYNLQAPVDLLVLSACRTGLGREVRGEGLIGLTRGFMHAGASSVVASLWKVDDEATAELMKYFYTNMLEKGMRPAEALRAAQNTLRQNPSWQSPHFWAGFTLQGEFREPIKLAPSGDASVAVRNAVGISLLLLLLGGIGWGLWRRRRSTS